MKTRKTSKQATKKGPIQRVETQATKRQKKGLGRGLKLRLLWLLLGSLAIVGILHVFAVYAQSPESQPTTCTQLMGLTDYPQVVKLQTDTQEMEAVQVANSLDNGAPAALIQVTTSTTPQTLD